MIKKILKILLLGILTYYLFLIELNNHISFLLISLFLINLLENPKEKLGIYLAFFIGLFWDIYSSNFIGLMSIGLPLVCCVFKIILFKYVRFFSISWLPKI